MPYSIFLGQDSNMTQYQCQFFFILAIGIAEFDFSHRFIILEIAKFYFSDGYIIKAIAEFDFSDPWVQFQPWLNILAFAEFDLSHYKMFDISDG